MKCENCGNENVEILNARKGHYLCGKCGRDTESLYEREHDKEIRSKAIEEFAERIKAEIANCSWQFSRLEAETIDNMAKELKGE